eukprot:566751-Pleurochrysis_carterae.AAC.1
MLKPSHTGAPPSDAAAKEAVEALKKNLGVTSIPSFNDWDAETIEKDEYAEKLQAVKDEAKLADWKWQATQERLDRAGQERNDALARGYEMGLAKAKK